MTAHRRPRRDICLVYKVSEADKFSFFSRRAKNDPASLCCKKLIVTEIDGAPTPPVIHGAAEQLNQCEIDLN